MEANYFLSSQKVVKYCFVPIFPKELFQIAFTAGVSPGLELQTHPQKWTLPKLPHFRGGGATNPSYLFFYKASLRIILKYFYHFQKY